MRRRHTTVLAPAVLAAAFMLLAAQGVCGIEPRTTEAVVYRLQSFAAQEYVTVYSPPQSETIYVIADSDNAFDPRTTLVYYWPLTQEFFESWDRLDAAVDGRLEILSGARVVMSVPRTEVVFSYPHAAAEGMAALVAGPAAREVLAGFTARRAAYERSMEIYGRQVLEYRRALRDYLRASSQGPIAAPVPKTPVEPQPPDELVTDPVSVFVVRLPAGTFQARVVDARGDVVEGSERRIVSFAPLGASGTGYEVIPEERWTARVRSEAPGGTLFCAPGKEMYVIPYVTETYRQDLLARLRDPQSTETSQRAAQVFTTPRETGRLAARSPGRPPQTVARVPWYVRQKEGSELGYAIVPWSRETAGSDGPTFSAYRLSFAGDDAGTSWRIALEDGGAGAVVRGSGRMLRVTAAGPGSVPWLFAAVPVAAGTCVLIWRKRK